MSPAGEGGQPPVGSADSPRGISGPKNGEGALARLAETVAARAGADPEQSWTAKLLARGPEACARKFAEEAVEAVVEAVRGDRARLVAEAADVLYHLLVMLRSRDVGLAEVEAELARREGVSGIAEKAGRPG
jgi:phosphoribosyl-ATP pyrophosphohydrolase